MSSYTWMIGYVSLEFSIYLNGKNCKCGQLKNFFWNCNNFIVFQSKNELCRTIKPKSLLHTDYVMKKIDMELEINSI